MSGGPWRSGGGAGRSRSYGGSGRSHFDYRERDRDSDDRRGRAYEGRDGGRRDGRGARDGHDGQGGREWRDARDSRDSSDTRDTRDARDTRDPRDPRDARDSRDTRDARDARDSREGSYSSREARDAREPSDTRNERYRPSISRMLPPRQTVPQPARAVSCFDRIKQVGEGTYGQVWSARDKVTGEVVALKKIRLEYEKDGFPFTAVREVKLLQMLPYHVNIVNLKEIVTGFGEVAEEPGPFRSLTGAHKDSAIAAAAAAAAAADETSAQGTDRPASDPSSPSKKGTVGDDVYMVFEYMDHDLAGLMQTGVSFSEPQIKCYIKQLLDGLDHIHRHGLLHRDIKGSNLLIGNDGLLKIADFGLAREASEQDRKYTNRVVTLWYRAPELLLGANIYDSSIDMWSVGCLLAEMLSQRALFPGNNEPEQIDYIFRKLGSPSSADWPEYRELPMAHLVSGHKYPGKRDEIFKHYTPEGRQLVLGLLEMNPKKRMSAREALRHVWFRTEPLPADPSDLPKYDSSHEYEAKRRRMAAKEISSNAQGTLGARGYFSPAERADDRGKVDSSRGIPKRGPPTRISQVPR